jgi:hypothetical protein
MYTYNIIITITKMTTFFCIVYISTTATENYFFPFGPYVVPPLQQILMQTI